MGYKEISIVLLLPTSTDFSRCSLCSYFPTLVIETRERHDRRTMSINNSNQQMRSAKTFLDFHEPQYTLEFWRCPHLYWCTLTTARLREPKLGTDIGMPICVPWVKREIFNLWLCKNGRGIELRQQMWLWNCCSPCLYDTWAINFENRRIAVLPLH